MISLKSKWLRMVVLLALPALWVQTSHSQTPSSPTFGEEASKQADIYRSRGAEVPKGYVIDRSLLSYTFILSPEFSRTLANLGPEHRWLDIGAGEGRAILDYSTSKYDVMLPEAEPSGRKARAVGMSIEDRRTAQWHETAATLEANQIQYVSGRRLREYSLKELGQFQVITDVLGGFSYTRTLSLFTEKTLGFLQLDGSFHTLLQDVRGEKGANRPFYPDASFLTEITNADGSEVKICAWLKSIACADVICELKADWSPPVEVYRIRKVCNNVTVPGLELTHFEAGTPPERRFRLKEPSSPSGGRTGTTP